MNLNYLFLCCRTNAYLYNDPHWSEKDLDEAINSVKKELSKGTKTLFGPTHLRYYYSELRQKQKEGHNISPIDMWGLIIENAIYGKVWFSVHQIVISFACRIV